MRVLVTGHEGYIGSVLVPMLVSRGHDVVGCDVGLFDRCRFAGDMARVQNMSRDIRELCPSDLAGFHALIHLAGLSNDPLGNHRPELTFEINCEAAFRVAAAARRAGVGRFLFASSCSVYGAGADALLDEGSEVNPQTPYGASKYEAEQRLETLADNRFSPVFLRAGTVFGTSPRMRFDLVLNNLVAWAAATGEIRLKSDGNAWRPLVHIEDVARAYVAALEAPSTLVHNEVFNIGRTRDNYRVRDLAEVVAATVPDSRIVMQAGASPDRRSYRVDCGKLEATFPRTLKGHSAGEGANALYDALKVFPVAPDLFEGAGFSRIAHIKLLVATGLLDPDLYWRPHVVGANR